MGRCRYENLEAIEPALIEIRKLEKIKETKPGIFYKKSQGFLHFHEKDNKIWADVNDGTSWISIDIPKKVSKVFLKKFANQVKDFYQSY